MWYKTTHSDDCPLPSRSPIPRLPCILYALSAFVSFNMFTSQCSSSLVLSSGTHPLMAIPSPGPDEPCPLSHGTKMSLLVHSFGAFIKIVC